LQSSSVRLLLPVSTEPNQSWQLARCFLRQSAGLWSQKSIWL